MHFSYFTNIPSSNQKSENETKFGRIDSKSFQKSRKRIESHNINTFVSITKFPFHFLIQSFLWYVNLFRWQSLFSVKRFYFWKTFIEESWLRICLTIKLDSGIYRVFPDLGKLNFRWWFNFRLELMYTAVPAASKNDVWFKKGRNWHKKTKIIILLC